MSLKNIVYLSEEDFTTLSTSGSLTKGGQTLTYDPLNDVYCVPSQTEKHFYLHQVSLGATVFGGSINVTFQLLSTDGTAINTRDLLLAMIDKYQNIPLKVVGGIGYLKDSYFHPDTITFTGYEGSGALTDVSFTLRKEDNTTLSDESTLLSPTITDTVIEI